MSGNFNSKNYAGRVPNSNPQPMPYFVGQNRNMLINGNFDIWQRGTTTSSNDVYLADRWKGKTTTGSITMTQQSDAPTGSIYSLDISSNSSGNNDTFYQRIESVNAVRAAVQQVTIRFYAKSISGVSTTIKAKLSRPTTTTDDFSAVTLCPGCDLTVTTGLTNAWVLYTLTFPALPTEVNKGLQVEIYRTNSSAAAQTRISQVQLEIGTYSTPFEYVDITTEMRKCKRYFEVWGNSANFPAVKGYGNSATALEWAIPFSVNKRISPTVNKQGTWTVTNASQPVFTANDNGAKLSLTASGTGYLNTAPVDTTTYVTFDAEL